MAEKNEKPIELRFRDGYLYAPNGDYYKSNLNLKMLELQLATFQVQEAKKANPYDGGLQPFDQGYKDSFGISQQAGKNRPKNEKTLYFPDQDSADRFLKNLEKAGFLKGVNKSASEDERKNQTSKQSGPKLEPAPPDDSQQDSEDPDLENMQKPS